MKLVTYVVDEAFRTIEIDVLLSADQDPQQAIESDEMIDMRMRYEYVFEPQDLARRQGRNIAQVEQNRTLFEQRLNVQHRISESPIEQARMQQRTHLPVLALRYAPFDQLTLSAGMQRTPNAAMT
jgi:hypothetical protein